MKVDENHPLADTAAAVMLANALAQERRDGRSLRKLAVVLGYKQAVVLSHMATGRAPIPINRAADLAEVLEMDRAAFIRAVLRQRHPDINWQDIMASPGVDDASDFVMNLEISAGGSLDDLTPDQAMVMREVAADRSAARRWLSVHEIGAIELLRELLPNLARQGLTAADREAVRTALSRKN